MKKVNFYILLTIGAVLFFGACQFSLPEKIKIKATPTLALSTGKTVINVNDYFSAKNISNYIKSVKDLTVYDYDKSREDIKHLLFQFDFKQDLDGIDFTEYMDKLNKRDPIVFGYEEDGKTPKVLFTLPKVEKTKTLTSIDIKDNINIGSPTLNPETVNVPEPGSKSIGDTDFTTDISFSAVFTKLLLKGDSKLAIQFDVAKAQASTTPDTFELNIKKLELKSGNTVISSASPQNIAGGENKTIDLPLKGKELSKNLTLNITLNATGGTEPTLNAGSPTYTERRIKITPTLTLDIAKIEGLSLDDVSVELPSHEIDLGTDVKMLKHATIGKGEIGIASKLPAAFVSGVTTNLNLTINQDADTPYNGLSITDDKNLTDTSKYTIDLKDQKINSNKIKASGTFTIKVDNATIDFTKETSIKPEFSVKIDKFKSITVDTTGKIDPNLLHQKKAISLKSIAEYVKTITFENESTTTAKWGFDVTLDNQLPVDVTLKVSSKALNLSNEITKEFPKQTKNTHEIRAPRVDPNPFVLNLENSTIQNNGEPVFDVDMTVDIGITSNKLLTLNNVSPGDKYSLAGKADLIMEWEKLTAKIPDTMSGLKGTFPPNNSIDLAEVKKYIGNDIEFKGIKAHIYASSVLFDKVNKGRLEGNKLKINASVKAGNEFLVGSTGSKESMKLVPVPKLIFKGDVVTEIPSEKSVYAPKDLSNIFNRTDSFQFDYDIAVDGNQDLTITKGDIDTLNNKKIDVGVTLLVDVPILFNILPPEYNGMRTGEYGIISLNKFINPTQGGSSQAPKDLLGRTGPNNKTFKTVQDFMDNAKLEIEYTNNTGIAFDFKIHNGTLNNGKYPFEKTFNMVKGEGKKTLIFTKEDASHIIDTYPFSPDMEIVIPKGELALKKNATLEILINGSVKTNVDYTLSLRNAEGGR